MTSLYDPYSLNVNTNKRNPWFKEFWEDYFDCKFEEATKDVVKCDDKSCNSPDYKKLIENKERYQKTLKKSCTGYEVITSENGMSFCIYI